MTDMGEWISKWTGVEKGLQWTGLITAVCRCEAEEQCGPCQLLKEGGSREGDSSQQEGNGGIVTVPRRTRRGVC